MTVARKALLLFSASLLITTLPLPAYAQNHSAQTADPDASMSLGEIIVTAQRNKENIQQVPISITALTSATLASRDLNDLSQIALAAPTLQIGRFGDLSIRGIGTLAFAESVDSSVATAVDDVNIARPNLAINLFNDVQRVEILNGPQGLLFGRNASAGLLNIVTNRPALGKLENIFSFETGFLDTPGSPGSASSIILRETLNLPVTDGSALRINGFYSYAEPPVTLTHPSRARQDANQRQYGVRAKYALNLSDALKLYVIGEYAESHGGNADNTFRSVGNDPNSIVAPLLVADGITAGPNNFHLSADGPYFRDLINYGAQGTLTYAFGKGLELSNIAAYKNLNLNQQGDVDLVSINAVNINDDHTKFAQFSDELRLALPNTGRLRGQVGLYYFQAHTTAQQNTSGNFFVPDEFISTSPYCVGARRVCGLSRQQRRRDRARCALSPVEPQLRGIRADEL